jgi:mRNA interferase MazF
MRRTRFEVETHAKFLRSGVFDGQNILTIPGAKLVRKLGKLSTSDLSRVEEVVRLWLSL